MSENTSDKCMNELHVPGRRYHCFKSKDHEGHHVSHGMSTDYLKAYRIEWA